MDRIRPSLNDLMIDIRWPKTWFSRVADRKSQEYYPEDRICMNKSIDVQNLSWSGLKFSELSLGRRIVSKPT